MSTRRRNLVALIALLAVAIGAVVVSRQTSPDAIATTAAPRDLSSLPVLADSAPPVKASGWLNTEPLDARALAGKVVLYDFWTYGCFNCVNTLPHVKAWHERYQSDGLVVLSIHTPEFSHEADPANVRRFVDDNDITYPVALDPDRATWRAFANRYWPAFYLHDRDGKRRYQHFGEGAYELTEDTIRTLLGVEMNSERAVDIT
jgi:thiol-disulfide isomerase/thioredoxin